LPDSACLYPRGFGVGWAVLPAGQVRQHDDPRTANGLLLSLLCASLYEEDPGEVVNPPDQVNLRGASVQFPGTQCPETAKQKALLSASGASKGKTLRRQQRAVDNLWEIQGTRPFDNG